MALTSEQVRAIRKADAVCFDYDGEVAQIRAIIRGDDTRGEQTTVIPVDGATVNAYDSATGKIDCFTMIMSAKVTAEWQTVARHMRTGKEVWLGWVRGNASPVTDEAGLVVDYLNLRVGSDTFRVANYVGRDNSARMVRIR